MTRSALQMQTKNIYLHTVVTNEFYKFIKIQLSVKIVGVLATATAFFEIKLKLSFNEFM